MGRIVRRFGRFYNQEIAHSLQGGTEVAPLTMATLDQRVLEASLEATAFVAVAGTVQALFASVQTSVAIVGNLRAGRVQAMVLAVGVVSGDLRSLYVRAVARATGEIGGEFTGVFVELNTDAGVTIVDAYAIHVGNMMRMTPSGTYDILRLDENGGATISNLFSAHVGVGDINFFFLFAQNTTAWNSAGDRTAGSATNAAGWLRVSSPAGVRYIQLFT